MVSTHSFIMFGGSTRNETCLSSGELAREMVAKFNAPPETLLAEPPTEFVPPANQSPKVVDRPPQVINEDATAVTTEDDEVMEVDNPAGVLSSD